MKPALLKMNPNQVSSFNVRRDMIPNFNSIWHYHSELELILFHKGCGTQFIGDSVRTFHPGDIVLVGPNIPHLWRYDESLLSIEQENSPYSTVIHFNKNFLGSNFLELPESRELKSLFEKSSRALFVLAERESDLAARISRIPQVEGMDRVILLLECLHRLASSQQATQLVSVGFHQQLPAFESDRISRIYNYTFKNFKKDIYIKEVASLCGFTPSSFCRYFKARTNRSYNEFLTEIRVGHACRLLLENNISIKRICYESGFNSFTSFHRQFKHITGKSPYSYQQQYQHKNLH